MKILLSVVLTLLALFVIFAIFIYSGWYNVSGMNNESGIMKWVFNAAKNNSVESRLKDISVPNLDDSAMIKEGFVHYDKMCKSCHGAPGKEQTELSKGLNPPAPYLVEHAKDMSPQELFWITKNGIKMTGMPAWGKTHSDEKIWAMVAFMKTLPTLSAEDYEKLENENGMMKEEHEHPGESDEHEHSHSDEDHHH